MESPQKFFKKITKPDEHASVLKDLAAARGEILCKGQTDSIFKFKAYKIEKLKMHCLIQANSDKFSLSQEDVIASFFLGGEKYFFQAIVYYQDSEVFFKTNFDLFQLQRRQNYRVKIPDSYKAHFEISKVHSEKSKIICALNDISSGGCKAVYRNPAKGGITFKVDDLLQAQIFVGTRESIEVTALVKYVKIEGGDKPSQTLGLEFNPLSPQLENRMFAITMDLHRELFAKMT